ncbi:hypothetical protein ACHAPT_002551 [Fusarium lateritium]
MPTTHLYDLDGPFYFPNYHPTDGTPSVLRKSALNDKDEMGRDSFSRSPEKGDDFWRSENLPWRLALGALVSFGIIPVVHSAWTMSRGFRVASGMTSTLTAMAVVPLRTASHIPQAAWIARVYPDPFSIKYLANVSAYNSTYVAWALFFSIYVWLQLISIPHRPRDKRTIYIFTVAMASLHFTVGLSQGAESIMEGAALFGPIVSTASAYLMSLLITINWREAGLVVYELA